jgi:hypothetical protein
LVKSEARLGFFHDPEMDPAIALMMHVELRNCDDGVSAIEGSCEALAGAGVVSGDEIAMGSIEERV